MKQVLNITLGMGMLWLSAGYAEAQQVELLKPKDLGRWNIPPGNYSGITPIGDGRYAVVSDKEAQDGFFVFRIRQDERTGQVTEVVNEGFRGTDSALKSGRDAEGVAFVPEDSLVWISGEADQRIVAYRMDGAPGTGCSSGIGAVGHYAELWFRSFGLRPCVRTFLDRDRECFESRRQGSGTRCRTWCLPSFAEFRA